jgi:ATP-grasp domain, R2K clade family 2
MKFLIQTIDGKIKHDFSFNLLKSIEYQKWLGNDIEYEFTDEEIKEGFIPIGTVEFVVNYLNKIHNKYPLPRNIPESLFKYSNRKIFNGTEKLDREMFVKSNDKIKDEITGIHSTNLPKGNYQFSDIIEIESEWRAFIFKNKLVGLQNYSGDFTLFPDIDKINKMINDFIDSPVAYTLDVGVNDDTFIIEVHDFFSCGLYGFEDLKILPYMFSQWFYEFILI